mmetsp:Transcript_10988/g.20214  ORF Transcript_10988/g.20214 Transcript_10988/m.20214 type:complete len:217 (+) Transcript_10988:243-893(+)
MQRRCVLIKLLSENINVDNLDIFVGLFVSGVDALDGLEHVHALRQPPEHGMLVVEPRTRNRRHEELRAIRVGSGVGHAQHARSVVPQVSMELVLELPAPDRLAARPVAQRVSALDHEVLDHAVEDGFVVIAVFRVHDEVLARLRTLLREQHEGHVAHGRVHHSHVAHRRGGVGHHVGEFFLRLLVEDVSSILPGLPAREPVESIFFVRAREYARVL